MLLLVFNRDPVIKEAVIGAVEQLFLTAREDLAKVSPLLLILCKTVCV